MRKFVFWLALIVSISIIGTFTLASSEKVTINFLISEPQEVETFEKINRILLRPYEARLYNLIA